MNNFDSEFIEYARKKAEKLEVKKLTETFSKFGLLREIVSDEHLEYFEKFKEENPQIIDLPLEEIGLHLGR